MVLITDSTNKIIYMVSDNNTLSSFDTGYNLLASSLTMPTATDATVSFTTSATRSAQGIQFAGETVIRGVTLGLSVLYHNIIRYLDEGATVRIETDNAGVPSGNLVHASATAHLTAQQLMGGSALATPGGSYGGSGTFDFGANITLAAATPYWIVLIPDASQSYYYLTQPYDTAGAYAGGALKVSTTAGATWGAALGDCTFMVWGGDKDATAYTRAGQTLTITKGWMFELTGRGKLTLAAGDTITRETLSATNANPFIRVGYNFGGGTLVAEGTSSSHVTIQDGASGATYRDGYALVGYYGSNFSCNYLDVIGQNTSAVFYFTSIYSTFEFNNCVFKNTYNAASPPVYVYNTYLEGIFNNCTFWKNNANTSYVVYLGAGVYQSVSFIDCDLKKDATSTTTYIYNGDRYPGPYKSKFINCTYTSNGAQSELTTSQLVNVYTGTEAIFGFKVCPTIVDSSGSPIENAVITLYPQFFDKYGRVDAGDDYLYDSTPLSKDQYAYKHPFPPTFRILTDSSGMPRDSQGNTLMWTWDKMYIDTSEAIYFYYGGSTLSARPNSTYTWKNDGTDYGYILTVNKEGYQGQIVYLNPNANYTSTITLQNSYTPSTIPSTTAMHDTVIFIRDLLKANITDPSLATRPTGSMFIETEFPERNAYYPVITISNSGDSDELLGIIDSANRKKTIQLTINIFSKNTKERDTLYDAVYNVLRIKENDSTVTDKNLHDFRLINAYNVDEPGIEGIHRKIIVVSYKYYT